MKIYLCNIVPSILSSKLEVFKNINNICYKEYDKYELLSKTEGLFIIENNNIMRHVPSFETKYRMIKSYLSNDLLVDQTKQKFTQVISQLPVNYILTKLTVLEYKLNVKSELTFVIECLCETNMGISLLVPINFYFIYNDTNIISLDDLLNNTFFKEEFNVFLSHFN